MRIHGYLLTGILVLAALPPLVAADPTSLQYRGVFKPDDLSEGPRRVAADVWRLTLMEARESVSPTATIFGYEWLTAGTPKTWNMVRTYTGTVTPADPSEPQVARLGDFYYIFPIFDQTAAPVAPPAPGPPGSDPYREDQGRNTVNVTPKPALAPAEKVFVRYTLETLDPPSPSVEAGRAQPR